ncbi:hypothetical protein RKE29_11815, partial [Streptomyces sp. B1866]|uniref:hypothetical protein n=1 Tax=Streptomyces sp. B1866 TaxID=3075431 RepID=UPI00288E2211
APGGPGGCVERRLAAAPPGDLAGRALAPYAVLPQTADLAARCGLRADLPDVCAVRRVSSKTWSNALVRALGLPGAGTTVRSVAELHTAVAETGAAAPLAEDPVLVKDPYGVSGRGTVAVSSPGVLRTLARVLARQTDRGADLELLVQARYDRVADFSAHFEVARGGAVRWRGARLMENAAFRYAGSRSLPASLERRLADGGYREVMEGVGAALAAEGYWGPVCVDSMLLRDGTLVPVLEINPRMSMGLLSLLHAERLAGPGVAARLAVRAVRGPVRAAGHPVDAVIEALADRGALYRAGGTGVLPLAAGPLLPPRGRLYYAVLSRDAEQERLLDWAVDRVLDRLVNQAVPAARAAPAARSAGRAAGEVARAR